MMDPATFQRDYPGIDSILAEIVYPVFGSAGPLSENVIDLYGLRKAASAAKIEKITRIAEYDLEGSPFNIFDVELSSQAILARSRVAIKQLLVSQVDVFSSSLIFFHYGDPRGREWRISYFAKGRSSTDTTAAKRYTFLCGKEHGCRTIAERFELLKGEKEKNRAALTRVFSVESLNKEFYQKLANWFFWALKTARFPEGEENPGENAVPLIRLITRVIFVWFMRKKGLIPDQLFQKSFVDSMLRSECDASAYYKAILQNLFFATLNTEQTDPAARKFIRPTPPGGPNKQYHVYSVYRYEDFFSPEGKNRFLALMRDIPFLNGGLFACLDDNKQNIVIDAFSDNPRRRKMLCVPDELFWTTEEENRRENLNATYGDEQHGSEPVLGLITLLEQYNFTIDENSRDEATVALDPELLGVVFENLLASYNPETATTARKQTGSFYTPREIVDYMVEESLVRYLLSRNITGLSEAQFRELLDNDTPPRFSGPQKDAVMEAIRNCRILDPACGSGAFPMGLLQNLVRILEKLDPVGSFHDLYRRKLHLIRNCIYGVDIQPIAVQISKLRCFISLLADSEIDDRASNRGIEPLPNLEMHFVAANSLLDVDLSAFDEWSSDPKITELTGKLKALREDYFAAKSHERKKKIRERDDELRSRLREQLVRLATSGNAEKIIALQKRLPVLEQELKKYQAEKWEELVPQAKEGVLFTELETANDSLRIDANAEKRNKISTEIARCRRELQKEQRVDDQAIFAEAEKLAAWDPFNQMATASFFNPKWMFGGEVGFDIVIGNPPYGLINKKQNKGVSIVTDEKTYEFYKNSLYYSAAQGHGINIYRLFVLRSARLLASNGIFAEIFPLAYAGDLSAAGLRRHIFENYRTLLIDAFPERDDKKKRVFEAVKMSVCILFLQNASPSNDFMLKIHPDKYINKIVPSIHLTTDAIRNIDTANMTIPLVSEEYFIKLNRICMNTVRLDSFAHCATGEIDMTFCKSAFTTDAKHVPMYRGAAIDRYTIKTSMSQGENLFVDEKKLALIHTNIKKNKTNSRIVLQGITGVNEKTRLKATIINSGYCANSVNYIQFSEQIVSDRYLLALLNSSVLNFFFKMFSTNSNVNGYEVDALPIVIPSLEQQRPIIALVDQILAAKSVKPTADTSILETQVDSLVKQLYGVAFGVK